MMIDSEKLKTEILESKIKQNEWFKEYEGIESYQNYYTGFIAALSLVEGAIAQLEQKCKPRKCRNCQYMNDQPTTGQWHYCGCLEKPFKTSHSHLVNKWNRACKYFKEKENG